MTVHVFHPFFTRQMSALAGDARPSPVTATAALMADPASTRAIRFLAPKRLWVVLCDFLSV